MHCVSGNILHLCILSTVKFEDKTLCCVSPCLWGVRRRGIEQNTVKRMQNNSMENQMSPPGLTKPIPVRAASLSLLILRHGFQVAECVTVLLTKSKQANCPSLLLVSSIHVKVSKFHCGPCQPGHCPHHGFLIAIGSCSPVYLRAALQLLGARQWTHSVIVC